MKREHFVKVVEETLDSLRENSAVAFATSLFWSRICRRTSHHDRRPGQPRRLLLGLFRGVPRTQKSVLTCRPAPITSCFIKRTSKRSALARPKFVIKFARRLSMNWVTILG